jgi:cysteinyl-tRNA synthetase
MSEGVPIDDLLEMGNTPAARLVDAVRIALYLTSHHFAGDFNTQGAVGELFLLVNRINAYLGEMSSTSSDDFDAANVALGAMVHLTEMFGILRAERSSLYATEESRADMEKGGGDSAKLADVLLALRAEARAEKNYALSDKIRDKLAEIGAEVRDTKDGARIVWK